MAQWFTSCGTEGAPPIGASCPLMKIIAQAPMRISFAGGGTDLSPFTERHGGEVVSATIDKYCRAELSLYKEGVRISTNRRSQVIEYPAWQSWHYPHDGKLDFIKELYGRTHCHAGFGGGFELVLHSDSPTRGGLGSSGAMAVAVLHAFIRADALSKEDRKQPISPSTWEIAYEAELAIGNKTGRQDHCAATFGGFNHFEWRSRPERTPLFLRNRIEFMDEQAEREIHDSLILFQIDERPDSGSEIQRTTCEGMHNGRITKALLAMKAEVASMRCALRIGDFQNVGKILESQWVVKRTCNPKISNKRIGDLYRELKRVGMIGGKVTGAGGGGHMLACCEPEKRHALIGAAQEMGARVIPFQFSHEGVTVRWERLRANGE